MTKGLFITLEGGEGVGKSTQLRLLHSALESLGIDVLATREPGGSAGAEELRQVLLFGQSQLCLKAEVLTHFAARFDHVERVIQPALAMGKVVICDRFTDSTMAYQGYGRADGRADILHLITTLQSELCCGPDITFLLEAPRDVARLRLAARGAPTDRYEQSDEAFHARMLHGFSQIAQQNPQRVRRIKAHGCSPEEVNSVMVKEICAQLHRI